MAFVATLCRPKANIHRLFAPPGSLQKSTHFWDPSKSTPWVAKVAPWPPFGRQGLHFGYFWAPFREPFLLRFLILFQTPQNLDFAIPYFTFACFKHPKRCHFRTPFQSLFRPHFGTPFGRAFWPFLAPQGADQASPCRFWTIFGTPRGPKWSLGATRGGQGKPKREVPRVTLEVPFASWKRPFFQRGPASHSYRFRHPLKPPRRIFGTPLGDIRLVLGPRG